MTVEIEIIEHDGTQHLLIARDWIQMLYKLKLYLSNQDITYPIGEDDDIKTITKKLKKIPKHY